MSISYETIAKALFINYESIFVSIRARPIKGLLLRNRDPISLNHLSRLCQRLLFLRIRSMF